MGTKGARRSKITVGGKAGSVWNGESRPPRSAVIREESAAQLAPVGPSPVPGRKDTRRWCKGKPGREHDPVLAARIRYGRGCRMLNWLVHRPGGVAEMGRWVCCHVEMCAACGKILRHLGADECPDYREP